MIVDDEFAALIPPLTEEEYKGLEASILAEGCRDALVCWNDVLVDGHNRYKICEAHGVHYQTIQKEFISRDEVKLWMIRNQLSRRNLLPFVRSELALKLKPFVAEMAKEKQGTRTDILDIPQKSWESQEEAEVAKIKAMGLPYDAERNAIYQARQYIARMRSNEARRKTDHIYFMRIDDKMKVGVSFDVESRLNQLRVASPQICLVADIPFGEGARKHENALKKKFADYLINGEVYSYSETILQKMVDYTEREAKRASETDVILARAAGVSHDTIAKAEKIIAQASEEVKAELRKGNMSINQAYKEIKNAERKANIQRQVEELEQKPLTQPDGLFDVVVMDPPWAYGTGYDATGRRCANPYPEMTQEQLKAIEIPASENCVMFLWTTHKFIWDAKELLDTWGFEYRNMLVWDKQIMGMGNLFRMQCEFCLVGTKGKPVFRDIHDVKDIIEEQRREHSRKPEAFYEMVNRLCVGRKLDYFSRTKREGWEVYGNDTEKFSVA